MEAVAYLDTHVVAWLYAGQAQSLSALARDTIEECELLISPMVLLELDYLVEIGRTRVRGARIYEELHGRIGLRTCELPFDQVVRAASALTWTPDPFDRLIVGQASRADRRLVTKDGPIRANYSRATW